MNAVTIDYKSAERMRRFVRGEERFDTYYLARCTCGTEWQIRADNIKHTLSCKHCQARKGYEGLVAKYGKRIAAIKLRDWRLANPTSLEIAVIGWLDQLGVFYEREYWFEADDGALYFPDFLVNSSLVIEANGTYWHEMPGCIERDLRKAEALRYAGFELLNLSEDAVKSGDGFAVIQAALKQQV